MNSKSRKYEEPKQLFLTSYPRLLGLLSLDISALLFPAQTSSLWVSNHVYMANEFKHQ